MTRRQTNSAGNAHALNQISECEKMMRDFGEQPAYALMAAALHDAGKKDITAEEVGITIKVVRALRSSEVDAAATVEKAQRRAKRACEELITALQTGVEKGGAAMEEMSNN